MYSCSPLSNATRYAITIMAKGMIANSFFFEIPSFIPKSSATRKIIANKNPPRPSFQLMLMVSGYATNANKVGHEINTIPAIKLLFRNKLSGKND